MNEALVAPVIPDQPPTEFELASHTTRHDTWNGDEFNILSNLLGFVFSETRPSSSRQGIFENYPHNWLPFYPTTASRTVNSYLLVETLQAINRFTSVIAENATENMFEVRRLTGFTWEGLADLMEVDQQTVHSWAQGGAINKVHRKQIAKTLSWLRLINRGSAEENAAMISQYSKKELTDVEAIAASLCAAVHQRLSRGDGASSSSMEKSGLSPATWKGEFQPLLMHECSSGFEKIAPLPDEPEPLSRKRRIKRV